MQRYPTPDLKKKKILGSRTEGLFLLRQFKNKQINENK